MYVIATVHKQRALQIIHLHYYKLYSYLSGST